MVTYEDIEATVAYSLEKGYISELAEHAIITAVEMGKRGGTHYTPSYIINALPALGNWNYASLARDILQKLNEFSERLRDEGREVEGGMIPSDAMGVEPVVYPAIRVLLEAIDGGILEMPNAIRQRFEMFLDALRNHENAMVSFRQENKTYNREKPSWWNVVKTF